MVVPMLCSERNLQDLWVTFGKKVKSLSASLVNHGEEDSWSIIQLQRLEVISETK